MDRFLDIFYKTLSEIFFNEGNLSGPGHGQDPVGQDRV